MKTSLGPSLRQQLAAHDRNLKRWEKSRQRGSKAQQSALSPGDVLRKAHRAAEAGKHEAALARIYDAQGIRYLREFFAVPERKFKWDFHLVETCDFCPTGRVKPEQCVCGGVGWVRTNWLVEVQGQIWKKGGHTSGHGVSRDAEKANLAAIKLYRQLIFTPEMIEDGRALLYTLQALGTNP